LRKKRWRVSLKKGDDSLMNPMVPLVHTQPGSGKSVSAVGDVYRNLISGAQTEGVFALIEAKVYPGGGPPPHIHRREDEGFYILEGEVVFHVGGERIVAGPGTYLQAPRDIPHAFKNEGTVPAKMLIHVAPAGFDQFIEELGTAVDSFDSPPVPVTQAEVDLLLALTPKYGIEILPPPV